MAELPQNIISSAFVATNGELAWRRDDIENAITAIRESEQAILGGEVWVVTGEHSWSGLVPQRDSDSPAVYHWETAHRTSAESWQEYCQRTAAESVDAVRTMAVEQKTPLDFADQIRFNLTVIDG
jgi:hypothetical protein